MSAPAPTAHRTHRPTLPNHGLGWAALVLLLAVIAVPAWWGALQNVVGSGLVMAAIAVVIGVTAFTLGGAAVRSHRDDVTSVRVALVLAAVVTALGLMVLVGFAFEGR